MNPMSQINEPIDVGSRCASSERSANLSIRALARPAGFLPTRSVLLNEG